MEVPLEILSEMPMGQREVKQVFQTLPLKAVILRQKVDIIVPGSEGRVIRAINL